MSYFSRESRLARRAVRLAQFDNLIGVGEANERRLTTQTAPQQAISMVRDVLNNYYLPVMPKLSYSGIRNASMMQGSSKLEDGVITIFAEMKTLSGVNVGFDIPIEIRNGKIMEPSVIVAEGAPRIIAQSTFDDLVERSTIYDTRPVREMFSPPMRKDIAAQAYSNRNKVTRVNSGMFSLGANRQAISDAIAGRTASLKEAAPEDYDSDTEHDAPDVERNQQDDDYLDPAERIDQNDLHVGQEATLKEELEIGDRGGVRYGLTKGTKCTILRDVAGDNKTFVVRFEDEGLEVIVERHFLKSAAPKNPPAPKAPPRVKALPKPPKTDKPKSVKHPPLLKKKPLKVCHKCNQSPCVCHRRKGQAIQEVGINIVNERFPGAIEKLANILDLSDVTLYRYKNTVAASPNNDDRYPEMFWDGKDWVSMGSGVHIAQAIEEIGVNIAQYQFPAAMKALLKMTSDLSNVELYKYKDTIAVTPQSDKGMPEMFWNGTKWVDFGGLVDKSEDREPRFRGPHYAQVEQSFPFPPQFPKKCNVCGRVYNSMEEWKQLPPPSSGKTDWITDFEDYDIRNCACDSTLAIIVKRKIEDPSLDEYEDESSDEVKADLDVTADEDLVAKVNEEVGGMRDRGLNDIDIRQAVQSKYGDEIVNAIFHKVAPEGKTAQYGIQPESNSSVDAIKIDFPKAIGRFFKVSDNPVVYNSEQGDSVSISKTPNYLTVSYRRQDGKNTNIGKSKSASDIINVIKAIL